MLLQELKANECDVVETYKKMWQHITGETSEPEVQKEEEVILDQIVVRSLSDTSSSGEDVESLNSDEVSVEEAEEEVESEEGAEPEQEAEPEERVELEEVEETADSQEDGSDDEPSVTNTSKGKQRALSSSLSPSPAPTVWTEDNAFDPPFPRGEPWVPKPNRLWDLDIPTSLKLKLEKYAFSVIRVTEKYAISRRDPDEISEGVEEAEQSLPIRARQARASWAIDSDDEGDEPAMDEYISHTMEEPQERPSSSQTHYPLDSDDDDDELSTEDDTVQTIGEPQKRPSNQTDIIVLSDDDISDEDEYMRIDKPPQEPVSRSQTRNTLEAVAEESDDQERQSIEAREMPSFRIERTSKPAQAGRSIADITPTYADDEPRAVIFAKQDI